LVEIDCEAKRLQLVESPVLAAQEG
jgi:hypothetical protein